MVELTRNLRHDRPQLGEHKDGGVEDACLTSNVRWALILRELICDAVEGFNDVTELRRCTLSPESVSAGSGNERSYTSVLNPTKALFQVGKVRQEFQQRADGSAFAVVVYLLNSVETLVDIPRQGERVPKSPLMPAHLISKSGLPSNSRNFRSPNFVLVLFKIHSNDPCTL
jgi:hypothetical protein